MIPQEKVAKNVKKYYQTLEKYGCFNDDLVEILGEEFIKAPASTRTDLHNAFEGGLVDHILKVTKHAINVNLGLEEKLRVNGASLIKVCLFHQIGKANLYVPKQSEWHQKQGIMYDFNDKLVSMRTGERSIYYVNKAKIELTEEEFSAILNFDKPEDDLQAKYHNSMLGNILKFANILAIEEERGIK